MNAFLPEALRDLYAGRRKSFAGLYGPKAAAQSMFFFCVLMLLLFTAGAQSISPSAINSSGGAAGYDNYRFEWSVGESASIVTGSNGNLVVSSGVLQPFVVYQPAYNGQGSWLPEEIKVYPNPTKDFIEINILHRLIGKNKMELYDAQGRKVMEQQFVYFGSGRIERWDLSKLAAGQYFLKIVQLSPVTGRPLKSGSFKILKIQ